MDTAGVETALLSAWHLPGRAMISNEQVAAFIKQHPNRFVGVASVDLKDPVAATCEVERAVRELGFKALRVLPWVWSRPPTDPLFYPLYVKCVELNIPFCTQVGHTGPLMPSDVGRPILHRPSCLDIPAAENRLRPYRIPLDRGDGIARLEA